MDIKTTGSPVNLNPYANQVNKQSDKPEAQELDQTQAAAKKDEVTLSGKTPEVARARKALEEVPDVNQEKVNEIKNQIENGTYQMDPGRIAGALMNDLLVGQISSE